MLLLLAGNISTYAYAYLNNGKCRRPYPFEDPGLALMWLAMGSFLFPMWVYLTYVKPIEGGNPLNRYLDKKKNGRSK